MRIRFQPIRSQRGVVMIITLIVLVALMIGGIALVRSADTSSVLAGQLAFRRDLKNQGERGLARALALLDTGDLSSSTARASNQGGANYSAIKLDSNAQGLPTVLMQDDAHWAAAGMAAQDISDDASQVKVRTAIDRLCLTTGNATDSNCTRMPMDCSYKGGQTQSSMGGQVLKCYGTAYRISVRVDGPRGTQAFFQSMVAR